MLTVDEEKYLFKIPKDKIAHISPYDPKIKDTVLNLREKLKSVGIKNDLLWIGASALGIAGQNDIDFHILSKHEEWEFLSAIVTKIFGERVANISIYKWELEIDGFEIELYLSDPDDPGMSVQIKVFNLLRNNDDLRREYESIKLSSDGIPFQEYMRRKYEFFHKILGN